MPGSIKMRRLIRPRSTSTRSPLTRLCCTWAAMPPFAWPFVSLAISSLLNSARHTQAAAGVDGQDGPGNAAGIGARRQEHIGGGEILRLQRNVQRIAGL